MKKTKKLVIIGTGETAEIAYEYFTYDSEYEVEAFSVSKKYLGAQAMKFGLPIVPFEELEVIYSPEVYDAFVAISYGHLNRDRTKMYLECKAKGFTCASYISSQSFVWHTVQIGENTFVFENNTIQHGVSVGNNVTLWSGNHIGHRTVIEDNVWLTSHCVISGFCHIGRNSFLGVNSTLGDHVVIGEDSVLAAGALTVHSLPEKGKVYIGCPAKATVDSSYKKFGIENN
ncbi:MAG: acetyltransferase [Clostridium sp.]|nr:acetyltransferase [Clostridium sp.]